MLQAGYIKVRAEGHPRADATVGSYVFEHILVAEKAIGKYLPLTAVVHHRNEVKSDNRNQNLVICENNAYHQGIHRRMRIVAAGGNPDTDRICGTCKRVKSKTEFHSAGRNSKNSDGLMYCCKECESTRRKVAAIGAS